MKYLEDIQIDFQGFYIDSNSLCSIQIHMKNTVILLKGLQYEVQHSILSSDRLSLHASHPDKCQHNSKIHIPVKVR